MDHSSSLGNRTFVDPYTPRPEDRVTVGKTASMRDDWYDSTLATLEQRPTATSQRLAAALRTEKGLARPRPEDLGKNIIAEDELEGVFPKELPRQLAARTASAFGTPLDDTAVEMRDSYIRHMNHKPWTTIEKDIHEPSGDTVKSTLTPVNAAYHENYAGLGQTGLGSMSGRLRPEQRTAEEKTRPINLWKTSLETDDSTLFEGFRSGAFVDTSKNEKEKKANADARAKGVLEAALIDKLGQMSDEERQRYLSGANTYNGTLVSIDLLSGAGADRRLADEHHETLARMDQMVQQYPITWDGQQHNVKAMFNVLDFKTGVNGANNPLVGPIPNAKKDYSSKQEGDNEKSWARLMGEVKMMQSVCGDTKDPAMQDRVAKIEALSKGVNDTGLGKSGSYQLPAMIANLAYQLGDSVHFNCKSGKDRTGIMDSETKFMARQLDKQSGQRYMNVPNVSERDGRTRMQNYEHDQMLWESGSLDVLAQNVGGQCLKTADFATAPVLNKMETTDSRLAENLGGLGLLNELGGLKRYADIDTITTFDKKNLFQQVKPLGTKKKDKYAADANAFISKLPPLPGPPPPLPPRQGAQPQPQQHVLAPKPLPPIPQNRQAPPQPQIAIHPGNNNNVAAQPQPQPQGQQPRPKGVPANAFKLF